MFVGKGVPLLLDFSKDPWLDQSTPEEAQENNKTDTPSLVPRPAFHWSGNETTTHHIYRHRSTANLAIMIPATSVSLRWV